MTALVAALVCAQNGAVGAPPDMATAPPHATPPAATLAPKTRYALFPPGHLFAPLVAAPREPQLRNSHAWARSVTRDLNARIVATEPGRTLSVLQRRGARPGDGCFAAAHLPNAYLVGPTFVLGVLSALVYRR
jgi:hypothetical protein